MKQVDLDSALCLSHFKPGEFDHPWRKAEEPGPRQPQFRSHTAVYCTFEPRVLWLFFDDDADYKRATVSRLMVGNTLELSIGDADLPAELFRAPMSILDLPRFMQIRTEVRDIRGVKTPWVADLKGDWMPRFRRSMFQFALRPIEAGNTVVIDVRGERPRWALLLGRRPARLRDDELPSFGS